MSVYYRPGLQGGFGVSMTDFGPSASGMSFTPAPAKPASGMVAMELVDPALSPDRGGYQEFTGTHRAPAASGSPAPDAFASLYNSNFKAVVQSDATQSLVKSGYLQIQTWAGYKASCEAAGGSAAQQADGSMVCQGPGGVMTMAGGGPTPGGTPTGAGGGTLFGSGGGGGGGGGGSGSAPAASSAFETTCKQLMGTYYSTGPCCALPAGTKNSSGQAVAAVALDSSGQAVVASGCGGGGAAGVAVLGGVALLALLLLR